MICLFYLNISAFKIIIFWFNIYKINNISVKELYALYKLKKELGVKNKLSENKSVQNSEKIKNENNIDNINTKSNNLNKGKENKPQINLKISSNLNLQNILSLMNDDQKLEQILNGFGGYVTEDQFKTLSGHMEDLSSQVEEIENRIMSFGKPQQNQNSNNRRGNK